MSSQPNVRTGERGSGGRRPGPRVLGAAAVPAALALVLAAPGTAAADPPDFTAVTGIPTLAVHGHRGAGAVDLRRFAGGGQVVTERSLALADGRQLEAARFGAAMISGDFNGDGDQDLIVAAPGGPGGAGPGRVQALFGSSAGLTAAGARPVPVPASVRAGDEFGFALAITFRRGASPARARIHDLWVGAPGHDVGAKANAGAVYRYALSPAGVITYLGMLTQDSALVPGVAEPGDRFGAVLGGGSVRNGVVVGVPNEDVGRLTDAGTVQRIRTDLSTDALVRGRSYSQNTKGVPGRAEAGDRFGAALSGAGSYGGTVVGVPGEDVGRTRRGVNAGAVQVFSDSGTGGGFRPAAAFTQDSPGIPGRAEAGDRFGAALTVGDLACQDWSVTAVAVPGEDIGRARDAGSLILLPDLRPGRHPVCQKEFHQGHGLPGRAETGDRLGGALGVLKGDLAGAGEQYDRLQIGVPGEDVGAVTDAGRVITGTGTTATVLGHQGGDVAGMRFGSVLAAVG